MKRLWCWWLGLCRGGALGHDPYKVLAYDGREGWEWRCLRCGGGKRTLPEGRS